MKTNYSTTPVICMNKNCGHKVIIESDYVTRNTDLLTEEIVLICMKCGGMRFKKMLK